MYLQSHIYKNIPVSFDCITTWNQGVFLCSPCIFAEYNQQDATFHNLFISVRSCTCFRRFFRPSSGAQNCTYRVTHLSDQYCYMLLAWPARLAAGSNIGLTVYVQFWAPDDGRKNRLKHVQRLTEINKLWNVASCWLYSENSYCIMTLW